MSCEDISEKLPELLSGALGREEEQEALAHLARCAECRRELAFWAQVAEAVEAETVDAAMPQERFRELRAELFGQSASTVLESLRRTGRALGMAGAACRLAIAATGL